MQYLKSARLLVILINTSFVFARSCGASEAARTSRQASPDPRSITGTTARPNPHCPLPMTRLAHSTRHSSAGREFHRQHLVSG
ncbi:hypothetical protein F3Y22_tig00007643pilonHSYRG00018 [Hibiscus syriacus]|uniref:Secreted protein n=1 Tax=Hibiscus syriacus TaxID=106335 RepID=A0A6A3CA78_HIBSY|nr:hypothetical protein F3Y22_tig00007643pilonHSYRG00018 [Hibiscus syriacus]